MKKLFILLFLASVLAISNAVVTVEVMTTNQETVNVMADPLRGNVYDLEVRIIPPEGVSVEPTTLKFNFLNQRVSESLKINPVGNYDFSNAIKIISYDDSVSLSLDEIPLDTSQNTLLLTGMTDKTKQVCEEKNFSGRFSDISLCNTKIVVGKSETYAENNGYFEMNVRLQEGKNKLLVKAIDPAGNTETQSLSVNYFPSIKTKVTQEVPYFIVGIIILSFLIGIIVWWRATKAQNTAEYAEKKAVTAKNEAVQEVNAQNLVEYKRQLKDTTKKWLIAYQANNQSKANEFNEKIKELIMKIINNSPALQKALETAVEGVRAKGFTGPQLIQQIKLVEFNDFIELELPFINDHWAIKKHLTGLVNEKLQKMVYEELR